MLGLEAQPEVAHNKGSSHGETRIIRLAYQVGPGGRPGRRGRGVGLCCADVGGSSQQGVGQRGRAAQARGDRLQRCIKYIKSITPNS